MLAAWLRPEERRCTLQDFIRTLELAVLLLQLFDAHLLVHGHPNLDTVINVSLTHP